MSARCKQMPLLLLSPLNQLSESVSDRPKHDTITGAVDPVYHPPNAGVL